MDRRFNCQYSSRPKCHHGNGAGPGNHGNHGPGNHGPGNHGNWWESALTPPLSANSLQSSQSSSSCSRFIDKHTAPCNDGCSKLLNSTEENRFVWDRTPYDKLCYERACHHRGDHHGDPHHHSEMITPHHSTCCHQAECDHYAIYNKPNYCRHTGHQKQCCPARPSPKHDLKGCECQDHGLYSSVRYKKPTCGCKNCRVPALSPLVLAAPSPIMLNKSSLRSLIPLTLNTDITSPAHLHFPQIPQSSGRARAYSCEAVLSSSSRTDSHTGGQQEPQTKNAVTSPTIPSAIQSDMISSTTNQDDKGSGEEADKLLELDSDMASYKSTTVSRATSPFIVKMATQIEQIPNDPAVKSLVKSSVMFNDVEYQVPTKIIRRSKSQELVLEKKENIYWEVEENNTPLKPPQQSCYSFFCTPRRKERRNVSADSVGSMSPLLKRKSGGGFFKLGRSSKSKHSGSCLNGKLLRGMMYRKTADNIHTVQPAAVSRVKIFNANSERFEAPGGRHTVQLPTNPESENQTRRGTDKVRQVGKAPKQSALGRLFKRRSEGGVRWKINPEYYTVRGLETAEDYVLPDDTFESVEL